MKEKDSKKRLVQIVTLIAIIAVPMIYGFFYLNAFWDPYSHLDKIPVAVVNEDIGTDQIGGQQQNFGAVVCSQLQAAGTFKYDFTDSDTAAKGLKNDKYYALITISDGFSASIASALTSDKKAATIVFASNEGRNYFAAQIMSKAVTQIEESVRGDVNSTIISMLTAQLISQPESLGSPAFVSILSGLENYMKAPVNVVAAPINAVPNNGTAFAPYFFCISLWLGAIALFFTVYSAEPKKFKLLSQSSEKPIKRSAVYLGIGLAQGLAIALIGLFALGLKAAHLELYFLACFLVALAFISIVEFLFRFAKDAGKLLIVLLLVLQLTASGGTYPMETLPGFFRAINPFMPMTYGVNLFRDAISRTQTLTVLASSLVLAGIAIVFTALNLFLPRILKKNKNSLKNQQA